MKLILASSSKYRRALLEEQGLKITAASPTADEEALKKQLEKTNISFIDYALKLAEAKALSVLESHPDAIVIGCDQICVFDEKITHKPKEREKNIIQLMSMNGQTHYLYTCVCIVSHKHKSLFADITELTMKTLSESEISDYVDLDQPFDCAGGYKFESHGHKLFSHIKNEDPSAIQGLPLIQTLHVLKTEFGVDPQTLK